MAVDKNEIVRAYAKEKGLSEVQAWAEINSIFIPKNEVVNMMQFTDRNTPSQTSIISGDINEATKVRMKQLDLDEKKLTIELETQKAIIRKAELDEKRLENDKAIALAKIENEKLIAERKLEQEKTIADRRFELDERRQTSKEDFDHRLQLATAGKDPEGGIVKIYERLFDQKSTNDEKLTTLRNEHELALKTLEKSMREDSGKEDIFDQMKKVKDVEKQMMETTLDSLAAYGVDVSALKKIAKIDEKNPQGVIEKVGGFLWDKVISPQIEKTEKEKENTASKPSAPSGLLPPKDAEDQIRKELLEKEALDAINTAKATSITLQLQIAEEKKKAIEQQQQQRKTLESAAIELGIPFEAATTNQMLYDLIIAREQADERERMQLESSAAELGIVFDPATTTRQQLREAITQQQSATAKPTTDQPDEKEHLREREKLEVTAAELKIQFNPEMSNDQLFDAIEAQEALNDRAQSGATNPTIIEGQSNTTTIKELVASALPEEKKKSHKKKLTGDTGQVRATKKLRKFTVTKDEGVSLGEHEATSAHLAAMKAAPEGTRDSPTKVKVIEMSSGKVTEYIAYRDESNHTIVKKPESRPGAL